MDSETNRNSAFFYKACFLIFGICGTIPWFSIISTLDFFVNHYGEFNVPLTILLPHFLGQGLFCILIYFLSFIISLKARVFGGLFSMIVILICIYIIPLITPNKGLYWLILFLIFILGSVTIIYQTSTTALCYIFPKEYNPIFFFGSSLAGVFMCLLRMIFMKTLESVKDPLVYSTFGILGVNSLILIGAILLYQKFTTTTLYFSCLYRECSQSLAHSIVGSHIHDFSSFKQIESLENSKFDNIYDELLIENQSKSVLSPKLSCIEISRKPHRSTLKSIENRSFHSGSLDFHMHLQKNKNRLDIEFCAKIFRKISPMMVLILLLSIQSLFVFPGMVIQKRIFREYLNESWNSIVWIFLFNFSDSFAKFITLWPIRLKINAFRVLVFLRFLFWGSFLLIDSSPEGSFAQNDWFCIVHLIAFGLSGGVLTNGLMFIALECGKNNEKETIGLLISIPLVYGWMIGSFLAIFSKYV